MDEYDKNEDVNERSVDKDNENNQEDDRHERL